MATAVVPWDPHRWPAIRRLHCGAGRGQGSCQQGADTARGTCRGGRVASTPSQHQVAGDAPQQGIRRGRRRGQAAHGNVTNGPAPQCQSPRQQQPGADRLPPALQSSSPTTLCIPTWVNRVCRRWLAETCYATHCTGAHQPMPDSTKEQSRRYLGIEIGDRAPPNDETQSREQLQFERLTEKANKAFRRINPQYAPMTTPFPIAWLIYQQEQLGAYINRAAKLASDFMNEKQNLIASAAHPDDLPQRDYVPWAYSVLVRPTNVPHLGPRALRHRGLRTSSPPHPDSRTHGPPEPRSDIRDDGRRGLPPRGRRG
jgi:hypothetical protein